MEAQVFANIGLLAALYGGLLMLGQTLLNILLALSVRNSVRANSVENGDIFTVITLCCGFIPAIVYACVKKKLATAPIDTPEKLACKKRSTACLVWGIVLNVLLSTAGIAIYVGGMVSNLMALS